MDQLSAGGHLKITLGPGSSFLILYIRDIHVSVHVASTAHLSIPGEERSLFRGSPSNFFSIIKTGLKFFQQSVLWQEFKVIHI